MMLKIVSSGVISTSRCITSFFVAKSGGITVKWIAVIVYETKIHFTVIPPDFARKNDSMHLDVEITPELTILNIMVDFA